MSVWTTRRRRRRGNYNNKMPLPSPILFASPSTTTCLLLIWDDWGLDGWEFCGLSQFWVESCLFVFKSEDEQEFYYVGETPSNFWMRPHFEMVLVLLFTLSWNSHVELCCPFRWVGGLPCVFAVHNWCEAAAFDLLSAALPGQTFCMETGTSGGGTKLRIYSSNGSI